MKNLLIIVAVAFAAIFYQKAYAGSPEYEQAMKNAVAQLDSAGSRQQFMQLANSFERIAGAEPKEWLPDYYAAYCYAMTSFIGQDKKSIDTYMDQAEGLINKAEAISPNNSEIVTLRGLINSGRIMVDPMSRGRKYGPIANQNYKEAEKLDSLNPRPLFLEGQGLFYTPKMFGGGKERAKPVLTSAVAKYKTFKPASDIAPHWGKKQADDLLKQCE